LLREALKRMGRADLIGSGKQQLVPAWQPAGTGDAPPRATAAPGTRVRTQHTGLPRTPRAPRAAAKAGVARPASRGVRAPRAPRPR
jgi:hypothetical protein